MQTLIFLKWGGSLITDKSRPFTPRPERIQALARALHAALQTRPGLRIVLGHGSGSFGHRAALAFPLDQDPATNARHRAHIARAASRLHNLVMDALLEANVPAVSFPPSAMLVAHRGHIEHWSLHALYLSLRQGLVPVIYGDAVLDRATGGTVLSTEQLFLHLAARLPPQRVYLAGTEAGVWADFPRRTRLLEWITPSTWAELEAHLQASEAPDVTGGMREKVRLMLQMAGKSGTRVWIFDGRDPQHLYHALVEGRVRGTCICPEERPCP